jgi:sulfite exporter TauE/SafE
MDSLSTIPVLTFGFAMGVKHAVEADHLAAISAIVSERKSVWSSSLVGGLWGIGHTASLLVAGVAVIVLGVRIGERASLALEFCVGLMLVALGANALRKLARGGRLHLHSHRHGGREHVHPHVHEDGPHEPAAHTHHGLRLDARTLLVGMLHGFAGSAALMLLVLSSIKSPATGLLYIAVFGVGSVGGMMLMSALVGLPLYFTAARFNRANFALRCVAGIFSLCFGLFMVYDIGFHGGLFR